MVTTVPQHPTFVCHSTELSPVHGHHVEYLAARELQRIHIFASSKPTPPQTPLIRMFLKRTL